MGPAALNVGRLPDPQAFGGENVNKAELIGALESKLGSKKAASDALESVLDVIIREVAKGGKVGITGFGTFQKVARAARTGRNPRTGATVKIKKTQVPRFRAGTAFKEMVADPRKLPKAAAAGGRASATAKTAVDRNEGGTGQAGDDGEGRAGQDGHQGRDEVGGRHPGEARDRRQEHGRGEDGHEGHAGEDHDEGRPGPGRVQDDGGQDRHRQDHDGQGGSGQARDREQGRSGQGGDEVRHHDGPQDGEEGHQLTVDAGATACGAALLREGRPARFA